MDLKSKERAAERADTWKISAQAPPAAIYKNNLELQVAKSIKKSQAKTVTVRAKAICS